MNKQSYKVIFSRVLNQCVVVSELVNHHTNCTPRQNTVTRSLPRWHRLTPIYSRVVISLLMGAVLIPHAFANPEMAIRADKSAPGHQQATILQTANGLPQINIQTPSAGGVSRNQYSQFDVAEKGAILNNARKATQTQLAGWVQGNPHLAAGEARVILNEVNSANPSRLRGYMEVAGKKADVVIANPSGIHCEGCGVINAARTTFTTGKTQWENGLLKGVEVNGGQLIMTGKGLDNSASDYTDIIAERVQLDGGVWGNKALHISTGKNTHNLTHGVLESEANNLSVETLRDKNAQETHPTSAPTQNNSSGDNALNENLSAKTPPYYAVDVGRLGGMYAERIYLVDKGEGLGVRNTGHIGASAGNVQIDSQGRIVNSGTVSAIQQVHLHSIKTIENTGKIETKQGEITLRSQKDIDQKGSMVSRQGGVSLLAKENIAQTGETVSKGDVVYQAKQIELNKEALIAAGVSVQNTDQGEKRSLDEQHSQGATIVISARDEMASKAKHLASGSIKIESKAVDLSESQVSANRIGIQSKQTPLTLDQATLYSEDRTSLSSPTLISSHLAHLNAGHFKVDTTKLVNQQGNWIQRGAEAFTLTLKEGLDNTQGKMAVEGALSIQSPFIQNAQGVLWSNDHLFINTDAGRIDSPSGYLFGKHHIDIHSATLNNQQGDVLGGALSLSAQQVNNEQGKILASNKATLAVHQFNNQRQGIVYSQRDLDVKAKNLLNQEGMISAVSQAVLTVEHLDNRQGMLQGENHFAIKTRTLNNEEGDIVAKNVGISAIETNNAQGMMTAQNSLSLSGDRLDNRGGVVQAKQADMHLATLDNRANGGSGSLLSASTRLALDVATLNNQQTKATQSTPTQGIQAGELIVNAEHLDNQGGGVYVAQSAKLSLNQTLNNQQGEILSAGQIDVVNPHFTLVVDNTLGQIESLVGTSLQAKTLANEGLINTKGDLSVVLTDSLTLNKAFGVGNNLTFSTKGHFINNTQLVAGNRAFIQGETIQNNAHAEISSAYTTIQAKKVDNVGLIEGDSNVIKAIEVNNLGSARIYGTHVAIEADRLNNLENAEGQSATIAARERLDLGVGELINHNHSQLMSLGTLHIGGRLDENHQAVDYARRIDNGSATIEALGSGRIFTHHLLNHDLNLTLGTKVEKEWRRELALGSDSHRYRHGVDGYYNVNNGSRSPYSYFQLKDGQRVAGRGWKEWQYTRTTTSSTIEHQDPAKILMGGDLHLSGEDLQNKHSQLLVGQKLWLDDKVFTERSNERLSSELSTLNNEDVAGLIQVSDIGMFIQERRIRSRRGKHYHYHRYSRFDEVKEPQHFNFGLDLLVIGEPVSFSADQTIHKAEAPAMRFTQKMPLGTDLSIKPVDVENLTTGMVKNPDGFDIKTHLPDISLPNTSLYKLNPQSGSFLIETDPRFTDRRQWLSSDYMFNALRSDPQHLLKRLGDGFYEQRLVNEQIHQLTGRRFLESYHSDYEQYKALMDSGVYYAKQWDLVPGVALTADQMKALTTDMVWMVKKEVTLKDGTKTEVLVPQVYIVARHSDINSRGSVVSANEVMLHTQGDIQNSGVIAGRHLTELNAENIENLGGRIQGRDVSLVAKNRLDNLGGVLTANDRLIGSAKTIHMESTSSETEKNERFKYRNIDRVSSVQVGDEANQAKVALYAQEALTIKGAHIRVKGEADFYAGDKLNLGTVSTENKQHYIHDKDNYYKLHQNNEVGNQMTIEGNSRFVGKNAVDMRGVSLSSQGEMKVFSEGDIRIEESRQQEKLSEATKWTRRRPLRSKTEIRRHDHDYDLAEGSTLDADKIHLHSTLGNVNVQGSTIVAENGLTMQANNIDIKEAENRVYAEDFYSQKKSGLLSGSGIGITIGSQKQTTEADQTKYYASGSQVGSLKGNTTLMAENHYRQTASAVSSVTGDVNILAEQVNIQAGSDKYETHTKQTFEQKGLSIALTGAVVSAIQAVEATVNSAKTVDESKNNRVNAMAAANAGFEVYRAGQAVGQASKALQEAMGDGSIDSAVGIQLTYGQQKSVNQTHTAGQTASTAQVNAGGKANIVATGVQKASMIDLKGADVSGKDGTTLMADKDINIIAAEQYHQERSTNTSSGFNAGVAIKVSHGVAAGITLGGHYGKGKGNGDDIRYIASHVGDLHSQTTLHAGGEANLIGSQVKGNRVVLTAQDLHINSLQDTATYQGKQMNVAGSVTVGYGVAAGGSYSQSKIKADYASVNEQAGIYAHDEGYDIHINQHTALKGAMITSIQKAEEEGKNRFSTGSLSYSDIANHSHYSGLSIGMSGSVAMNIETPFGQAGNLQSSQQATDKEGHLLYTDSQGNTTVNATNADGSRNTAQVAHGWASLQTDYGIGYGSDQGSQSSITKSGINTQHLLITEEAEQQRRTGKTVAQRLIAIKTDITTDNAQTQSGKLANTFNKDEVQKELNLQREVTESFGKTVAQTGALIADKLSEEARRQQYEAATELAQAQKALREDDNDTNRTLWRQAKANAERANQEVNAWEIGGSQRRLLDSALNVLNTALGGRPVAEVVASGLSPTVNQYIKEATMDKDGKVNTALNLTTHALWGAVQAYAGKRPVLAGVAGAVTGEAAATMIADKLYGKSPDKLSQEEKRTVSTLSQVAAGIAGGTLANRSDGVIIATKTAKDAVENNYLTEKKVKEVKACLKGKTCNTATEKTSTLETAEALSQFLDSELQTICQKNPLSDACRVGVNTAIDYIRQKDAWHYLYSDVKRSSEQTWDYIYNRDQADKHFVHYFNTIDARANFFGASNLYEKHEGSDAKWFEGAEKVSRACFNGLGADGCISYVTFAMGKAAGNPDLYGWRKEAGDTLMKSGFNNFRELYNNKGINPMEWDIKQLKSEQSVLQPIHEKYLKGYDFFNFITQGMSDNNSLFGNFSNSILSAFDIEENILIDEGVNMLDYSSRIKYGCKLLGYSKEQGCTP